MEEKKLKKSILEIKNQKDKRKKKQIKNNRNMT